MTNIETSHFLANCMSCFCPPFLCQCLNPNSGDTGGILKDDWVSVEAEKLAILHYLQPTPSRITRAAEGTYTYVNTSDHWLVSRSIEAVDHLRDVVFGPVCGLLAVQVGAGVRGGRALHEQQDEEQRGGQGRQVHH